MGIKTALAGITLTADDLTQAEAIGMDVKGMMAEAQTRCDELTTLLTLIQTKVMTPASDTSNATTVGMQITALA